VRDAARTIFESDNGLVIESGSWKYKPVPHRALAEANFSLSDGKNTVFNNVKVLVLYASDDDCKIRVQASINGLSPTYREFYVIEECLELAEIEN